LFLKSIEFKKILSAKLGSSESAKFPRKFFAWLLG